tara:strand:+ start:195 stop:329 length:135 start_codon:yes stop_codon:yes gene_type:complete
MNINGKKDINLGKIKFINPSNNSNKRITTETLETENDEDPFTAM